MVINRRRIFMGPLLMVLFPAGAFSGQAQTDYRMRAASVLLKTYETVVYARPGLLSSAGVGQQLALPFDEFVGSLNALGPNSLGELRPHYTDLFVGARDFSMPEGLGAVASRRCYIAVATDDAQGNIDRVFQQAKQQYIGGRQVWRWAMPPSGGRPKLAEFYAATVGSRLLIVANNQEDFVAVINDLTSSVLPSISADRASVWKNLNAHEYWAYRVFRRSGIRDSAAAAISGVTANISALTFFADVDTGSGMIRIFCTNGSIGGAPEVLPAFEMAQMQPTGAGIWEAGIPLSNDERTNSTLFQLFYFLGFGVII